MAQCRSRTWAMMRTAGLDNVIHCDTDSVIVTSAGAKRLEAARELKDRLDYRPKSTWRWMTVYGPRNYRGESRRKLAGVPKAAFETAPNTFIGERWDSLAHNLGDGGAHRVTIPH